MVSKFEKAMAKMAVLGQDRNTLTDCSEVIPMARKAKSNTAYYPPGKCAEDIEHSVCNSAKLLWEYTLMNFSWTLSAKAARGLLSRMPPVRPLGSPQCMYHNLIFSVVWLDADLKISAGTHKKSMPFISTPSFHYHYHRGVHTGKIQCTVTLHSIPDLFY